jgi:hypothetical protein
MRFGIKTRPEHTTWAEMRDVWVAADDIELFESAWNWDHFYPLSGDLAGPNYEGWSMLAALAQATRRIRLGCQVSGMIYRHPAVLANMAATIDVIAEGRLDIGIGAGWNQQECDAYGIELPPLRERFDLFDEGVQVIIGLLSQETTNFDGKYFKLTDARCEPKGVQRPHPPIVIGGRGPRRTLRAVALWVERDRAEPGGLEGAQGDAAGALRRGRPQPGGHRVLGECRRRPGNRRRARRGEGRRVPGSRGRPGGAEPAASCEAGHPRAAGRSARPARVS